MKTTYFMIFKRYATKIDVPSTLYIATENSDDSLKKIRAIVAKMESFAVEVLAVCRDSF